MQQVKAKKAKAPPKARIALSYTRANGRRSQLSGFPDEAQCKVIEALIEALSFGTDYVVAPACGKRVDGERARCGRPFHHRGACSCS